MAVSTYILNALTVTPTVMERIAAKLTESAIDAHPDPNRFSVREVICHLADWEPIFLERLLGAVQQEGYKTVSIDEGELAIKHDYAHQDFGKAMTRFKHGRESLVDFVKSLDDADLAKSLTHHAFGEVKVIDMISFIVGHDVYHIEQLTAFM
jgi:uncharacterized damage-inducible protein DinB